MTSSLVGSEMCIRDRKKRVVGRKEMQGRLRQNYLEVFLGTPHKGSMMAAVSYTHLTLPTICSV
eukprot:7492521-Prorocentrum_lima.AAC.1